MGSSPKMVRDFHEHLRVLHLVVRVYFSTLSESAALEMGALAATTTTVVMGKRLGAGLEEARAGK